MKLGMDVEHPLISAAWLSWLEDLEAAARRLAKGLTASDDDILSLERQSLQFAIYARGLTIIGTCLLLAKADKQLDLRICVRGVIECAIHLEASLDNLLYLDVLKQDDQASRRSRARKFLNRPSRSLLSRENRRLMSEFVLNMSGAKRLNIDDLPETRFFTLLHEYREISADAAHVTFTALARHSQLDSNGTNRMILDPSLSHEELQRTLCALALACLLLPWLLIRACPNNGEIDTTDLDELKKRFNELQHAS